ncbi:tetratricopeptide repeat protein [Marinicellulosiphila megalodicopiae]|uniref:tetratricopeptide repeat protein n=1 Tax=Marinicellulosiphila megalodicopiae TaxID=2724896 RepID=UPI003BAE6FF0
MMNTKIYKAVHDLTEQLMLAAQKEDQKKFDTLYATLKAICEDNDNSKKDHPVQWETLGDFTDDFALAVEIYKIALKKSIAIHSDDHIASVAYSMATMQLELDQKDEAIKSLKMAKESSLNIEDKQLKAEIHDLLYPLEND